MGAGCISSRTNSLPLEVLARVLRRCQSHPCSLLHFVHPSALRSLCPRRLLSSLSPLSGHTISDIAAFVNAAGARKRLIESRPFHGRDETLLPAREEDSGKYCDKYCSFSGLLILSLGKGYCFTAQSKVEYDLDYSSWFGDTILTLL